MDIYEIIVKNLEEYMKVRGVKLNEVSKASGVPQSRLHKFMSRNQERISLDDLSKITQYFNITLDVVTGSICPLNNTNKQINRNQSDKDLSDLLNKIYKRWDVVDDVGRGVLIGQILPVFKTFDEWQLKRELGETDEAKTA